VTVAPVETLRYRSALPSLRRSVGLATVGLATVGLATVSLVLVHASIAQAKPRRPRFEPSDLAPQAPGELQLDLQVGHAYGSDSGRRLFLPDFEIDLGVLPNVELDIDGSFSIDAVDNPAQRHLSGDALWTSVKLALYESRSATQSVAVGVQLGPRLPIIPDTRGIGYGAIGLVSFVWGAYHLILNAGGIIEPGESAFGARPLSLVGGTALSLDLDPRAEWSFGVQSGLALYTSKDPYQLTFALGLNWNPRRTLGLSLTSVFGAFNHSDRMTLLLGFAPTVSLW
jgi:hypothetical protein